MDFEKVYLSGESIGVNIVYDVAIRVSVDLLDGVKIVGLSLIYSYFVFKDLDVLMKYLYLMSSGMDDDLRLNSGVDSRLI